MFVSISKQSFRKLLILVGVLCLSSISLYAQDDPVTITINPDDITHEISPYVLGANHGPWAYVPADFVDDVDTLGINFIRFPGGNWGDDNIIRSYQLDDVMFWAGRMGADVSVSVNLRDGTPDDAAGVVQYALNKGYDIQYWAIGNEPNLFGEDWDTERYNVAWRETADAMLAVNPDIEFIGPDISQYRGNPTSDPRDENGILWLDSFLEANGDMVSIVTVHRYPFPSFSEPVTSIEALRNSTLEWQNSIPILRETIQTITGEDKPIAITEINSHWNDALLGEATPDSYFNAIWWADVLGQLIKADAEIVAYFTLQSNNTIGGYGLYAGFDVRPTYYVYKLYQHFGTQAIAAESSQQFVNAYAAIREDGRISVILINLTDEPQNIEMNLSGDAEMLALTQDSNPTEFVSMNIEGSMDLAPQSITLLLLDMP